MRRGRWPARALPLLAAAVLLAAACSSERAPTVFDEDPTGPVRFGPKGKRSLVAAPKAREEQLGFLELEVRDQDGVGRAGVRVRYEGLPAQGTFVSGARGQSRVELPPGNYTLEIKTGCVGRYEIFDGTTAQVGIALGRTTPAPMIATMRPRYDFVFPATWSPEPPWGRSDTVTFSYTLRDRCKDRDALNTTFPWMEYRPDGLIRLVGRQTMRSDGEGFVTVRFRCVAAGDPKLWLMDSDTNERTDVLSIRGPFAVDVDRCR